LTYWADDFSGLPETKENKMEVGFIGLGRMGLPMARNLLKAGHALTVYNRTHAKSEALQQEGARIARDPSEASKGEALITMLADDRAVEEIVFGHQLISTLPPNAVHVLMSTISVALAGRLAMPMQRPGRCSFPRRFLAGPRRLKQANWPSWRPDLAKQ
jgi:3-hydroxyisobutyrate dehydrogenase-like beta-hydroxyacid dehydrogenase